MKVFAFCCIAYAVVAGIYYFVRIMQLTSKPKLLKWTQLY